MRRRPLWRVVGMAGLAAALATTPAVFALRLTSSASGTTYYVDSAAASCSDSGPGTSTQPFCTIQRAAAVVQPGDAVEVMPGNGYSGPVTIARPTSGSGTVTFHGMHNGRRALISGGSPAVVYIHDLPPSISVVFDGFEVTGPASPSSTRDYGIWVRNVGSCTDQPPPGCSPTAVQLSNNYVHGNTSNGIQIGYPLDTSCRTSQVLVQNNLVAQNNGHGIHLFRSCSNLIQRNVVTSNTGAPNPNPRFATGIDVDQGSNDNVVDANVAYNNDDTGIQVYGSNPPVTLANASFEVKTTATSPSLSVTLTTTGHAGPNAQFQIDWGDGTLPLTQCSQMCSNVPHQYQQGQPTQPIIVSVTAGSLSGKASLASIPAINQTAQSSGPTAALAWYPYSFGTLCQPNPPAALCIVADATGSSSTPSFQFSPIPSSQQPSSSNPNAVYAVYSGAAASNGSMSVTFTLSDTSGNSAQAGASLVTSTGNIVTRNVSYGNHDHGFDTLFAPGTIYVSNDAVLNDHRGFSIDGGSPSSSVVDSIASSNARATSQSNQCAELYVAPTGSPNGFVTDSNVLHPGGASCNDVAVLGAKLSTSDIPSDPQFVAPTTAPSASSNVVPGLQLQPTSPAIDTANTSVPHFPGTDPLGNSLNDRGVYEYVPPATATPTATPSPGQTPPSPATYTGYWEVAHDGGIFTFGSAQFYGSMGGHPLNAPVVGIASTPSGHGYWMVASDGGIFTFGDAQFYGSMGGHPLNAPIVGMAATPDGGGYWMVAKDGGIFTFGDAQFYGSMGGHPLNAPIVGMARTPNGKGYWLVASDGGIFTFGNAQFFGSMGGHPLNAPIVGMAATQGGYGYWMVASDGGIFSFGTAHFYGSEGGKHLNAPIVGMAVTGNSSGYWLVASDGGVFTFGNAPFYGSMGGHPLNQPIFGLAPTAS